MPRHGTVGGRLTRALCSVALAGLVLSTLSSVAEASGAARRPEHRAVVRATGSPRFVALSPSATLQSAYRAARAESSFELLYEVPLALFGSSPSKPVFWVLQTKQSSRAVEQYQLTLKGKLVTTYVLFSAQQTCTWFAARARPLRAARSPLPSRPALASTRAAITRRSLVSCHSPAPIWRGRAKWRGRRSRGWPATWSSRSTTTALIPA